MYLLGKLTSFVGRIENLVVEDGEVESKTKTDRVRGLHLALGNVKRFLVSVLRLIHNALNDTIIGLI